MVDIFDKLTRRDRLASAEAGSDIVRDARAESLSDNINGSQIRENGPDTATAENFTARKLKDTVQELLKYGLLEAVSKPNLYQIALGHQPAIAEILEPLDLVMRVDDIRGLAFLCVAEGCFEWGEESDEWSHPLVRRQRLTMEQSLLVALLRQHFIAHELDAGVGAGNAVVALEDLLPDLQLYLGALGSDAREQTRLRNLLDKLKTHGIVSDVDNHEQVSIRPIIAHVANPENLINLLQAFREQASSGCVGKAAPQVDGEGGKGDE